MAKDTEKLIRQLSLISFLMAERRPVTALEIKQEVEGYSGMNDDAFARRFYADRAELESLGIELKVDKPAEGYYEAENYSLPPQNFYLPAIEFTSKELGALNGIDRSHTAERAELADELGHLGEVGARLLLRDPDSRASFGSVLTDVDAHGSSLRDRSAGRSPPWFEGPSW